MKKLILALLLSTSAFADVSLKAFTENDFGVEYQLGSGVSKANISLIVNNKTWIKR